MAAIIKKGSVMRRRDLAQAITTITLSNKLYEEKYDVITYLLKSSSNFLMQFT